MENEKKTKKKQKKNWTESSGEREERTHEEAQIVYINV